MPNDFTSPSQQWNVQDQINASGQIIKDRNKKLEDYNKKTDALVNIDSTLTDFENQGVDVAPLRKKFDDIKSGMELGFGEKLGVVGRNIGTDYVKSFNKLTGQDAPELSFSQKVDEAKQKREQVINPLGTIATDALLDPLTYTPINFASKGTKVVRALKDFGKGGAIAGGTYTARHAGGENFNPEDALIAGGIGGVANAGLGALLNKTIEKSALSPEVQKWFGKSTTNPDVTSGENITLKILSEGGNPFIKDPKLMDLIEKIKNPTNSGTQQTAQGLNQYSDLANQNLSQEDIAKRINDNYFGSSESNIPAQTTTGEDPFRGNFPLKNESSTVQTSDPFVYNPKATPDQYAQHTANMGLDKKDYSPTIIGGEQTKTSKLPDVLPFDNAEEMKNIMWYAKDNNAVDEFLSKLPARANKDNVADILSRMKPAQEDTSKIVPVTINKKEPIINYDIPSLQEFEGLTKANGENTADVLSLSTPTNTQGVRSAIDRYINGTATQRDHEILGAVDNFMKYVGDNFRTRAGVTKPDTSMKIDDAIRNNVDFKTADNLGAIPFANGGKTLGGAFLGGTESEFNQRDYNNDGVHDAKDNLIGALIGVIGVHGARKLFPKAFKDENLNSDVIGAFVSKSDKQEKRGIYNVTFNGKNSSEVRKENGDFINFAKGDRKYGAEHIKVRHIGEEKTGSITDAELLDLGNIIRNGTIENKNNKNVYTHYKEDGTRLRAIVGENKDGETVISYYSDRRGGSHNAQPINSSSPESISNNIPKSQDKPLGLIERAKLKTDMDIATGKIPERGRIVVSPYENGKQYYLGDSGKVYFQKSNGLWRETPNEETIKDVNYVAKNGLTAFKKMQTVDDTRFEKAMQESIRLENERNNTYKMDHKAPNKDNGTSSYDVTDMFSKDIYSKDAVRLHGHGATVMDKESISVIQSVKNKPDADVTIYRAVPKDLDVKINPDDWVTTSREYAKVHGESALKGNYKILEMKVKAKDLYTDGNSIHEWGWSPNKTPDGMIMMSSPSLSGGMGGAVFGSQNDINNDGKVDYRDILYGAIGGAGLTKGALLARNTNVANKAMAIVKNIADTDTADKIFGHKIYQKTDYMALRDAMISSKNKQAEKFAMLHEQLKLLDDTTRSKMYDYMSGKAVQLDQNIKQLADNYIGTINNMGKELVDLGVIDAEQFNKFKDRYLHRIYEKDFTQKVSSLFTKGKTIQGVHSRGHEWNGTKAEYEQLLNSGQIGDFFDGKIEATRMSNGQYKFRQDWTEEQRARWGEVKDIAFSLPETLMRSQEMIDHATMLKKLVDQTNYVSNDAIDGYVQLSGKRYGALNGKYVPADIASDIKEFGDALFGTEGKLLGSKAMEAFKALSTFWKKSHTVYNPIAHLNNLFSNVAMQFGAGINPNKAVANAYKGAMASQKVNQFRELTAKKIIGLTPEEDATLRALSQDEDLQLWNKAQESGLFGRSNLNDILNKYVNPNATRTSSSNAFKNGMQKADEVTSKWYQGEDDIMRFSMLKSLMNDGSSFEDAISKVNSTIPDYTKPMSQWARFGRNSMLTPFISWTYYATPIILKQFKEHPERILAMYGALYGMNKMYGIDPFDERDMPQQNFSMKRIPIYKNGNEVTTVKVDRWIPHNDILNPLDFVKNLTSGGAWSPIKDLPRNQDSYFGGKITNKEGGLKAYHLTKYAVEQITPDVLDNIYGLGESMLMNNEKRTKNPVTLPRTTTQELLKLIGINSLTYNQANQARKVAKEKEK